MRRRWGPELERTAAVDVWSTDMACAPDASTLAPLLDDSDRVALRQCRPESYAQRAGGRAAVRLVLARYTGSPPRSLRFATDALGKRCVRGHCGRDPLHFSVSRSGHDCVVAVTRTGAIGIDIKARRRPLPGAERLIRRLAPEETAALLALDPRPRQARSCDAGRKEAYLKPRAPGSRSGSTSALSTRGPTPASCAASKETSTAGCSRISSTTTPTSVPSR